MTPEQRAAINRANAQKSTGPKTEEGKAKSSRNAIKHGKYADPLSIFVPPHTACHANDDRQAFYKLFDTNIAKYKPNDDKELEIVRAISDADWALHRNAEVESAIHSREFSLQSVNAAGEDPRLIPVTTLVFVFEALANNPALKAIRRHNRQLQLTIKDLERRYFQLKKLCPAETKELASNQEDKSLNLLKLHGAPVQIDENEATQTLQIHVRGPITPSVRDLYRALYPNQSLELLEYEDLEDAA